MTDMNLEQHIAAANAQVDQLVAMQRTAYAEIAKGTCQGVTRDDFCGSLIGMILSDPPADLLEIGSLGAIAILAIDRLARIPQPELPEMDF